MSVIVDSTGTETPVKSVSKVGIYNLKVFSFFFKIQEKKPLADEGIYATTGFIFSLKRLLVF
jgi:hypothetical protein